MKKLNSLPRSAILQLFKITNTDLQFRSPDSGWQKNEKKKKNTGNCKALCVLPKRNKWRKKDLWLQREEVKY